MAPLTPPAPLTPLPVHLEVRGFFLTRRVWIDHPPKPARWHWYYRRKLGFWLKSHYPYVWHAIKLSLRSI